MARPQVGTTDAACATDANEHPSALLVPLQVAWDVLILGTLVLLLGLAFHSFTAWKEYYGALLTGYPFYIVVFLFLFGVISGVFGRTFGLSNLFWHERPFSQLLAGGSLTLLLTAMGVCSYTILHDLNGDQIFVTMREHRDSVERPVLQLVDWLRLAPNPEHPESQKTLFPVDVCEVNDGLRTSIDQAHNYARLWYLVWTSTERCGDPLRDFVDSGNKLGILPDFHARLRLYDLFLQEAARRGARVDVTRACETESKAIKRFLEGIANDGPGGEQARWNQEICNRVQALHAIKRLLWTEKKSLELSDLEDRAGAQTVLWYRESGPHERQFLEDSVVATTNRANVFLVKAVLPWLALFSVAWIAHRLGPRLKQGIARALGRKLAQPEFGAAGGAYLMLGMFGTFAAIIILVPTVVSALTQLYIDVISPRFIHILGLVTARPEDGSYGIASVPVLDSFLRLVPYLFVGKDQISPEIWLDIIGVQLTMLLVLLGVTVLCRNALWVAPAVALCWILMFLTVLYGLLVHLPIFLSPFVRTFWMVSVLLVLLAFNRGPFKLRFPGMGAKGKDYYEPSNLVTLASKGPPIASIDPSQSRIEVLGSSSPHAPIRMPLLDSGAVLENWKQVARREGGHQHEPILVVLTTTGGSIRAAYWTAKVLSKLEQVPGFVSGVRLVTGASGGMLGAGLYVALQTGVPDRGGPNAGQRTINLLPRDSLSDVARCLALHDVPGTLHWGRRPTDRGQALEEAWERIIREKRRSRRVGPHPGPDADGPVLLRPFRELAAGEEAGWRPSLIFTPMMVEDGKRLFISNLDLRHLTENSGSSLTNGTYSQSGVEFFRLFPEAEEFRLSTAIRMSATFPFVSPAVSLPTLPPRRVVDAGYYDNYGVNTACMWVEHHKEWLLENTAGVLMVQVRAFPESSGPTDRRGLADGLSFLTSPINAVMQARRSVMTYRNDELMELLSRWFQRRSGTSDFFQSVTFACSASASLSWHITKRERANILNCFEPDGGALSEINLKNLESLRHWWTQRSEAGSPWPGPRTA